MLTLHNAIPVLELCSVNEMFNYTACLGIAFWKRRMPDFLHCSQDYPYPPITYVSITETKNYATVLWILQEGFKKLLFIHEFTEVYIEGVSG
jgi:hypothetical protein